MRGVKSFIALLVIALGLGAYLYFVESKRTPGDDAPEKEKVFTVEADKIDEVTIKAESGDRTTTISPRGSHFTSRTRSRLTSRER